MTKYEEIAKNETSKYHNYPRLVGILWIGSSSFGIEDDLVDIDIRLLVKSDHKSQSMQQYKISNIKVEVDEMQLSWLLSNINPDSEQAWIIDKAIILFDPNDDITTQIDEAKNTLLKIDNKKLLWDNYSQLYCHYDWEKSLQRNQLIAAHIILSNILDSLSKFVFLYQNRVIPPQKWRWLLIRKDSLFNMVAIDKLIRLNPLTSKEEMVLLIKDIQKECQKIMLTLGFEKNMVMEPWRF